MIRTFPTELGYMALASLASEVVGLTFGHPTASAARVALERFHKRIGCTLYERAVLEPHGDTSSCIDRVVQLLLQFADGEVTDFDDILISAHGMTAFQQRVVAACRAIPWGETISYGQLAVAVGHPGAARAVGTVMRTNRVPLIVPCHRVVASNGKLGGYSAPSGLSMKKLLLATERRAVEGSLIDQIPVGALAVKSK